MLNEDLRKSCELKLYSPPAAKKGDSGPTTTRARSTASSADRDAQVRPVSLGGRLPPSHPRTNAIPPL